MNVKLAILCARLWLGGLLGMIVSRGVLDLGPGELCFDLSALASAIGWLTYCWLGVLSLTGPSPSPAAGAEPVS